MAHDCITVQLFLRLLTAWQLLLKFATELYVDPTNNYKVFHHLDASWYHLLCLCGRDSISKWVY